MRPKTERWLGVSHKYFSAVNYFILTDIGKVIARTTVQHLTAIEVKIRRCSKSSGITTQVFTLQLVVDLDDDNVFIYNDEPREPMIADDGAYYGFEKDVDVDVDEAVDCTSTETDVHAYDHYIDAELQLPDKDAMKRMTRVCQILRNADGNPEV